ncbi:MAG: magnesium transporter CorA family protein [Prevotellaceae bacterium]|jgi:magnesium transporter|nr:magnesium transporter CorA family protein [Prevotellaceae bacterium]
MRKYLYPKEAFAEKPEWMPHCWVNVETPDEDDMRFMLDTLHLPEEFIHDIADTDERPRTEHEGEWLLTILRIPIRNPQGSVPFVTIPIGIINNADMVVTVCYYRTELIPDFIEHARHKHRVVLNMLDFILRMINSSAVWFQKYLKEINNDVNAAEKELEKSIRNEDLLQLMKLQKSLVFFNTSLRGNEVMIGRLRKIFQESTHLDIDLVEDVVIELKQAYNTVNIYSDILVGMMDAYASVVSNNVNVIMKRMTSLSITLMIPTLIASFYGMNVDIRPFPYAFAVIILISAVLSAIAFLWFRKIRWF